MKLFIGRLHEVSNGTAYLTVRDPLPTGISFQIQCDASITSICGIKEEFVMTLTPLHPKHLTEEDVKAISEEVDRRLH